MPEALILLHTTDNVLVCRETIAPGRLVIIDGDPVTVTQPIEVGHKVARVDLRPGDKILKYGAPIGSMTQATPRGGNVHMHNMKSDYIPSHTRNASGGAA